MDRFIDILISAVAIIWVVIKMVNKQNADDSPTTKKRGQRWYIPQPEPQPVMEGDDFSGYDGDEFAGEEFTAEQTKQPFSYETMKESDFKKEFTRSEEKDHFVSIPDDHQENDNSLNFDKNEVYRGIVYSEILKRKYC